MNSIFLAAIGCLCWATVASSDPIDEKPGHYFENRPRLGHFKQDPFIDLYKTYATAFVLPKHPSRHADDYRNYLPSGDECMVFFEKFQVDEYKLTDLDDFIVLDACLGYLYESEYHEVDTGASAYLAENLPTWLKDDQLKAIYQQTHIDDFEDEAKDCIYDLFEQVVQVKLQFNDLTCNNHWLQVFLNFAKCQKHIPKEARETDSYMNIVYELVKIRGERCFLSEISLMNEATRKEYKNNPASRVRGKLSWNKLSQQAYLFLWPNEIKKLLKAFGGFKKEINLREVNGILRGIGMGNDKTKQRLFRNMANYANEVIAPKKGDKESAKDPDGIARYTKMVDGLCNFFRPSNNANYYDFATPLKRMVEMLEYPEIFGITHKYFLTHVVNHSFESAPIYFSVSACNLLTFTQGQIELHPQNSKLNYIVGFKKDLSNMVVWPDSGFF